MHWKVGMLAALMFVLGACSAKSSSPTEKAGFSAPVSSAPAPAPTETQAMPMPVKVGDLAPTGTLVAMDGSRVALASAWEKGPALIVFYRGHW